MTCCHLFMSNGLGLLNRLYKVNLLVDYKTSIYFFSLKSIHILFIVKKTDIEKNMR